MKSRGPEHFLRAVELACEGITDLSSYENDMYHETVYSWRCARCGTEGHAYVPEMAVVSQGIYAAIDAIEEAWRHDCQPTFLIFYRILLVVSRILVEHYSDDSRKRFALLELT